MNTKYIITILVGLTSQTLFISQALAGTPVTQGSICIKDGSFSGVVIVNVPNTVAGGFATLYDNGDTSDPNTSLHTTKGRYFKHTVMSDLSASMWINAINPIDLSVHSVNATTIRAYWDNYYSGLATGYGNTLNGPSVSSNCHGYSMGYSAWVEDNSYILADDFTSASGWSDCTELTDGNNHSVAVTGYTSVGPTEGVFLYGFSTSEKNQASDVYTNYWFNGTGYATRIPSNATTQYKHN